MRKILLSTTFRVSLIAITMVFGVGYVWQTNTVSTKGYLISDLEKQITQLENETRSLDVQIAEYKSMQSLQERLSDTELVAVTDVDYLTLVGTTVAKR